jgi:hypothetical protein
MPATSGLCGRASNDQHRQRGHRHDGCCHPAQHERERAHRKPADLVADPKQRCGSDNAVEADGFPGLVLKPALPVMSFPKCTPSPPAREAVSEFDAYGQSLEEAR